MDSFKHTLNNAPKLHHTFCKHLMNSMNKDQTLFSDHLAPYHLFEPHKYQFPFHKGLKLKNNLQLNLYKTALRVQDEFACNTAIL